MSSRHVDDVRDGLADEGEELLAPSTADGEWKEEYLLLSNSNI
jgi:hypothetical protein